MVLQHIIIRNRNSRGALRGGAYGTGAAFFMGEKLELVGVIGIAGVVVEDNLYWNSPELQTQDILLWW
jgi:hypothetical protein